MLLLLLLLAVRRKVRRRSGRPPPLLALHFEAHPRVVPQEQPVMERAGVRTPRHLPKSPSVQFAREAGVFGARSGLGGGAAGTALGEVTGQHPVGEDVRTEHDEGSAVGEPGDDGTDGRVGKDPHETEGEDLLTGLGDGKRGVGVDVLVLVLVLVLVMRKRERRGGRDGGSGWDRCVGCVRRDHG